MVPTAPHPMPTVHPDLVLATVRDLADRVATDGLDLDAVDGEFYWRFCRPGLAEELGAARRIAASVTPESPHDEIRRVSVALAGTARRLYEAHGLPPNVMVDHAANGEPRRMRGVTVFKPFDGVAYLPMGESPPGDHVIVRSASSALMGEDLEARVRSWVAAAPPHLLPVESEPSDWDPFAGAVNRVVAAGPIPVVEQIPAVVIHLQFALRLSREWEEADHAPTVALNLTDGRMHVNSAHLDPPYVEVVVGLPLPPPGVVATAYDEVVLRDRRWQERLVLPAQGQEAWTSVRTWGCALLAKSGMRIGDALRDVERAIYPNMPDGSLITQSRYQQDKAVLAARVPEAAHLLRLR